MNDYEWYSAPDETGTVMQRPGAKVLIRHGAQSERSQVRLAKAIDLLAWLSQETRHIDVLVDHIPPDENGQVVGTCPLGRMDIVLSPVLFTNASYEPKAFMPVLRQTTALIYVLAHEWGHSKDARKHDLAVRQRRRCPCRLEFPEEIRPDEREHYAEAWAEWYLTQGQTSNRAARWYAAHNMWRNFRG